MEQNIFNRETPRTLNEIVNSILENEGIIIAADGEISPELEPLLEQDAAALAAKVDGYSDIIRDSDARAKAIGEEIKRLQALKKTLENKAAGMKDFLRYNMERLGSTRLDGDRSKAEDALACAKREDVIPASKIFDAWCDYVAEEYDCDGREVVDGEYMSIDCNCDFEESDENAWNEQKMATLTLRVDDCDEDQATAMNRVLHLYRWRTLPRDVDVWFVHYPPHPEISSIAAMSGFDVMPTNLTLWAVAASV